LVIMFEIANTDEGLSISWGFTPNLRSTGL